MSMLSRTAATLGVLSLSFAAALGGAHAAPNGAGVVGYLYVEDNTAGTNTVAGFDRHADGSLTPIYGSPFSIGGAGNGGGTGSQGAIQVSSDGHYLLAVDAGSNQISVSTIQPDGSLVPAAGGPVSSGGIKPVSIAVHNSLVYVANAGDGSYTGFTLGTDGTLSPLAGSTVSVANGASANLGDVLFNATGTSLVGIEVGSTLANSKIDSFTVSATGYLTSAPGSPFQAQANGPFGSEFRPTNPSQLFVSNAHAGAGLGTVSAFSDDAQGNLTSIGASPYPDNQTAPCWLTISPNGQYLFAVNTASSTISRYAIAADGTLSLLGSTPLNGGAVRPTDPTISENGHFLYVVEAGAKAVGILSVNGSTVTELPGSPAALPAGATPAGIAIVGNLGA